MNVPTGDLVRSRVVPDARRPLEDALDRRLTGYAVVAPTSVLNPGQRGVVVTFENGVPVVAYHVGSDCGGPAALATLSTPGPYRVNLYESAPDDLAPVHESEQLCVDPGAPAERVAGAPSLAERTRRAAPADRDDAGGDPLSAFLADAERIEAIREDARAEARRRAEEWGFDEAISEE